MQTPTIAANSRILRNLTAVLALSATAFTVVVLARADIDPATEDSSAVIVEEPSATESAELLTATAEAIYGQKYIYIRCNSPSFRRRVCDTGGKNPVKLWRQHSRASCVRRRDWNTRYNGEQIWVDNGCQATFRVRRG